MRRRQYWVGRQQWRPLRTFKDRGHPLHKVAEAPPLRARGPGWAHWARLKLGATRWLGIWLDSAFNLVENGTRRIGRTRQAEARLRRTVNQYAVPPAATRNLQSVIVQGTMLYASELTWKGGKEGGKE